jgi:hypothetical protein
MRPLGIANAVLTRACQMIVLTEGDMRPTPYTWALVVVSGVLLSSCAAISKGRAIWISA